MQGAPARGTQHGPVCNHTFHRHPVPSNRDLAMPCEGTASLSAAQTAHHALFKTREALGSSARTGHSASRGGLGATGSWKSWPHLVADASSLLTEHLCPCNTQRDTWPESETTLLHGPPAGIQEELVVSKEAVSVTWRPVPTAQDLRRQRCGEGGGAGGGGLASKMEGCLWPRHAPLSAR